MATHQFVILSIVNLLLTSIASASPQFSTVCCDFESSDCSPQSSNWLWSKQYVPSSYVPKVSGDYMWSDQNGAAITFPKAFGVTPTTNIYFTYYVTSVTANIQVYFLTDGKAPKLMDTLASDGTEEWIQYFSICNGCCQNDLSCDGQISFVTVGSGEFVTAVDNYEIQGHCYDSVYCCYFNDISMCGYTSDNTDNYSWTVSQATQPTNPPPISTGSEYVYFETVDYADPSYLFVNLRSNSHVTITDSVNIRGYFYVEDGSADINNMLAVSFYNEDQALLAEVGSVADTAGMWRIVEFSCGVDNCCFGTAPCTGYVVLTAHVAGNGGSVLYAIDAFDIGDTCDFFPG